MKVKNLNGTTWKACKCAAWTNHWFNFSPLDRGEKALYLMTCNATSASGLKCVSRIEVGAHVQQAGVNGPHFIVPLCHACNRRTDEFFVPDALLVSANTAETCDRPQSTLAKNFFGV